jgi:hypothetical protein
MLLRFYPKPKNTDFLTLRKSVVQEKRPKVKEKSNLYARSPS